MSIIGTGTDIIEVLRIEKAMKDSFLARYFTEAELELFKSRGMNPQTVAANFAAKEAFVKALGTGFSGGIAPNETEVLRNENGKPIINIFGVTHETAALLGAEKIHISLSHTKEYAMAFVVLEGTPNT